MDSNELRSKFLGFFEERGHQVVPSASLIPHDPSVLFTIAGMVPFKPYFLGDEKPPASRLTSVQKCFRTVDLDIVGSTTRHTTFFEMLGNFSFGDYFKEGAIDFAWELFTQALGVDGDKLWVTVHDTDDEAEEIWRDRVGVPANRIQRMGEDNFWKMGETGPCGPCSEIYYDKGSSYGADGGPAQGGDERFVEVWNLVFMEKNNQDGQLLDLPSKNVDTGAGLERLLALLTGKDSIFETSAFTPMLEAAQSLTGASYGKTEADDVRLRILADHARAMTILASDGVIPGNEGRGYVMRRVVRRAVLAARRLGSTTGVVEPLVQATVESMSGAYPILQSGRDQILATLQREEEGFDRTLRNGLKLLEEELASGAKHGAKVLSGATAFTLHDTHGFPVELTEEIVAESGMSVDRQGFDAAMTEQQERARSDAKTNRAGDEEVYREILQAHGQTVFTGRDALALSVETSIVTSLEAEDGIVEIFLASTPFYAESGGQVGDTGSIETATGKAVVIDTINALPGLVVHRAKVTGEITAGQSALAAIDIERRNAIRRNHTATHLLHAALREVLGDHVRQQGSLVAPDRLRFDFTHTAALSDQERVEVIQRVNAAILQDPAVETTETSKSDAEAMGAVAFFGDKYGETVRVVRAGSSSLEFCGGTHVDSLGMIGSIQLVSEASIGASTRRIEAISGLAAVERSLQREAQIQEIASTLRSEPEEIVAAATRLFERARGLDKELAAVRQSGLSDIAKRIAQEHPEGAIVARLDGYGPDELRQLAQDAVGAERMCVLAGVSSEGKPAVVVVSDGSHDAKAIVRSLAGFIQGGGGGNERVATAGGRNPEGIAEVLEAAQELLRS